MSGVKAYLTDLLEAARGRGSAPAPGVNLIQDMLGEVAVYEAMNAHIQMAMPRVPDDVRARAEKCRVAVSYYRDGGQVNRPRCIRKVGDEYWVAGYYQRISRFTLDWAFLGFLANVKYGNPVTDSDAYRYISSFCVDTENNRLFVALTANNMVRAFDLETGQEIWTFGDGNAGDLSDDRLYTPLDVELLPGGNVLVCSYNGRGVMDGVVASGNGFLAELNGANGSLVACRKMYRPGTDGSAWSDSVANPARARILADGKLYVSLYNGHHVGCWDVSTWELVKAYSKPPEIDFSTIYPRGLCLSAREEDGQTYYDLVVACNGPRILGAADTTTLKFRWTAGTGRWDDKPDARNIPGEFWGIWDVLEIEPGLFAVADEGNNRISIVSNP